MKVALMSDIHLEHRVMLGYDIDLVDADVLILAGDILTVSILDQFIVNCFFTEISEKYKKVLFVFGNHEFYGTKMQSAKDKIRKYLKKYGVIVLDDESVMIDGIKFIGSTLWSDTSLANKPLLSRSIADYQVIYDENIESLLNIHRKSLKFIQNNIVSDCFVITHHAPSYKSVSVRFDGSLLNSAFYTDLEEDFRQWSKIVSNVKYCHGHMHNRSEYSIGNFDIYCNPYGYPRENDAEFQSNSYSPIIIDTDDRSKDFHFTN